MERYNKCTQLQKEILDSMYMQLGFNEVMSFNDFVSFIFKDATTNIKFENILNHVLSNVVKLFWNKYPEYKNNYIKFLWLRESRAKEHFKVGSSIEFDPKGVLRYFIKENYNFIGK